MKSPEKRKGRLHNLKLIRKDCKKSTYLHINKNRKMKHVHFSDEEDDVSQPLMFSRWEMVESEIAPTCPPTRYERFMNWIWGMFSRQSFY
jgi:hypothetical protein